MHNDAVPIHMWITCTLLFVFTIGVKVGTKVEFFKEVVLGDTYARFPALYLLWASIRCGNFLYCGWGCGGVPYTKKSSRPPWIRAVFLSASILIFILILISKLLVHKDGVPAHRYCFLYLPSALRLVQRWQNTRGRLLTNASKVGSAHHLNQSRCVSM